MTVRPFFLLALLLALTAGGFAQVDHPQVRNKPDAPLQITEAHCGQNAEGSHCYATLQVADAKETWDGYGLLWTVTFEDGSKTPLRYSGGRSGRSFKPREIVSAGNAGNGGIGFGMKDRNKKPLRVTDTQVEIEFVVNTNGTVWGDSKSPAYLDMVAARKRAKEGTH